MNRYLGIPVKTRELPGQLADIADETSSPMHKALSRSVRT